MRNPAEITDFRRIFCENLGFQREILFFKTVIVFSENKGSLYNANV